MTTTSDTDAKVQAHAVESKCYCAKYEGVHRCGYHEGMWDGLDEAAGEIEKLRAAITEGHHGTDPFREEVRQPPHGDYEDECGVCAMSWPCWAAEALGEQP